jgi:hypothetical protein
VAVSGAGITTTSRGDINLSLDENQDVNFDLSEEVIHLEALRVVESRDTIFGAGKISTGSNFGAEQVSDVASVRRNLQDVARLDSRLNLQSLDQGGQLSAAGQNFRFNSFLIDGVQANDPFGLNGNGFSSLRSPIPLSSVQALSIDLSPYDVRRSGFTGALLNAVTKSGTNQFHGELYYEYTNQDMRAKNPVTKIKEAFDERAYGFAIGGPLIPNKLFFFFNYDDFRRTAFPASANFVPDQAVLDTIVARATALGYDTGAFLKQQVAQQKTYLGKIDWNINEAHRLSFTYRRNDGTEPITPSYTNSTQTSLSNYWYQQPRITDSFTTQLFSSWTPDFRTEASFSYTKYDGTPKNNGKAFPEVAINGVSGLRRDTNAAITSGSVLIGTELSRQFNYLYTKTKNGSLVAEYSLGDHTIALGSEIEAIDYTNKFIQRYNGTYSFTSVANWTAGTPVGTYQLAKPFAGHTADEAFALWNYDAIGVFLGDTWKPNTHLTFVGGLRLDYPYVPDAPPLNPGFESIFGIRNNTTNSGNYTISPRLGFNYLLPTKQKMQLRGGAGLFQGKNPAVWISNAYSNAGSIGSVTASNAELTGFAFNPDPATQVAPGGTPPAPSINVTDPKFKQPLLWKSNLAFDYTLPVFDLVATAEFGYSKTEKAPTLTFLNYKTAATGPVIMPDGRIRYAGTITPGYGTSSTPNNTTTFPQTSVNGRRWSTSYADVFYLTDTNRGESNDLTLQLARPMKKHWATSLAWTRGHSTEVNPMTSSTASSNYSLRASYNPNEDVASTSNYDVRDKFVATVTYQLELVKKAPTRVSLVFEARTGRPYSWVFKGDANGDGYSQNDLLYVPAGPSDPKVRFLNASESDAFFAFVDSTNLRDYKGRVVPRNSERSPWIRTIDLKISQDIPIYRDAKLEVFANVINFANLFNKKWGIVEEVPFSYRRQVAGAIYDATGNSGSGQYVYLFNSNTLDGVPKVADETPASRWQVQVGARVKF